MNRTSDLSLEKKRMRSLQQRRAEAAAERASPRYATHLREAIARRTCGLVSFTTLTGDSAASTPVRMTHTLRFPSAEYLRQVQEVVDAVTLVLETRSTLFVIDNSRAERHRGQGQPLEPSPVSQRLLWACGTPFLSIRLEFPAAAFHPYFELLEEVLADCGRPTTSLVNPRVDTHECASLNVLVEEIRRRALAPRSVSANEEGHRPRPHPALQLQQRGLQRSPPDSRMRWWEAIRKNRGDFRRFLRFLAPSDSSYQCLCFTATRADSDAFSAQRGRHAWDVNTFAAELRIFDLQRNAFMRQLKEALSAEPAAERIRVLGKVEHCLHGGLRLLVIVILPQSCSATPAALQGLMENLWRKAARVRSNVALVPTGIDRYANPTTKGVVSLRDRIIDRVIEVDSLVRLDVDWIARNSRVNLANSVKTITRFAV